ncbi:ribonuclease domain-containing protein [Roseateles sp. BYS180W]|uniref:Ribonuclease domain-containing protein n=1 Tax=Roseateles rivi TaxID=3299028 RepID=A0ABW7FTA4_9BURK
MLEKSAAPSVWRRAGLASVALAAVVLGGLVQAKDVPTDTSTVAWSQLPAQARATHQLILSGGPFPYEKDGTVFGNRERLLPIKTRGYYREYTVPTPGLRHRGARRLVCGGTPPTEPEVCFYTGDHYASFKQVVQ